MSNRSQVCLFFLDEMTILVSQNAQFEFRQVLRHYCLLQSQNVTVITSTHNLALLSLI